jgi:hypothetical protein
MNGVHPEIGTIVGPNWLGELLVVREHDERGALLGYFTQADAVGFRDAPAPRSLTEINLA